MMMMMMTPNRGMGPREALFVKLLCPLVDNVKTVGLSHLKQHNFVSITDIKTKLIRVAYIYNRVISVQLLCIMALSSFLNNKFTQGVLFGMPVLQACQKVLPV